MRLKRRVGLLAIPLIPVVPDLVIGNASMASNTVPETHVDQVRTQVLIPLVNTALDVDDAKVNVAQADSYKFIGLGATLTDNDGTPLSGMTVEFKAGPAGTVVCTGVTNHSGHAGCDDPTANPRVDGATIGSDVPTTYTAAFDAVGKYAGTTGSGALTKDVG
jgi:hypothetical protein